MRAMAACLALSLMTHGAAQEQATGVILGRVVDASTGAPLPSVVVSATTSGLPPAAVLTDAQGRFGFSNLPKASYTLAASLGGTGFSVGGFRVSGMGLRIAPYLDGGFGQRRPNGPLQVIDLGSGERVTDAVIRMWRGGAISGQVFDEAGEPLVDVVVVAVRRDPEGRLLNGPTTRTDDQGRYRLGTLVPGRYVVLVPQMQLLLPATTIEAVLTAPSGEGPSSRLSASGAAIPPRPQVPGAPPDAGIKVGASFITGYPELRATNMLPPAGADGRQFVYQSTFHPSATSASRATQIAVGSGEERQGINVQLTPVAAAPVSGTLVDASGPVANFGVSLLPQDAGDGTSMLEVATTASDASGSFVFPLVPEGSYRVLALRTGSAGQPGQRGAPPPPAAQAVADTPGAWASQDVAVGERGAANIVLTLRPGLRVTGRFEFHGTAERPTPEQMRQFAFVLTRLEPLGRTHSPSVPGPLMPTGEFAATGAFPGNYLFTARGSGSWQVQSIAVAGRDVTETIVPLESDVKDVVVTMTDRPAEISGTVKAAGTDAADIASVFLFPANRDRWTAARLGSRAFRTVRVRRDGTFVVPDLVAGEYLLVAASDEIAGEWPDRTLLAKLASRALTVRLTHGEKQVVSLAVVSVQ